MQRFSGILPLITANQHRPAAAVGPIFSAHAWRLISRLENYPRAFAVAAGELLSLDHGIAKDSNSFDFYFHDIPCFQKHWGFAGETNSRWSAGKDQIPGL